MRREVSVNRSAVVLLVLAGCQSAVASSGASESSTRISAVAGSQTVEVAPVGPSAFLEDESNTMAVYEAAAPATVFVTQQPLRRSWGMQSIEVPAGSGTGFVWDKEGHIVTNYHVVAGGSSFTITLENQRTYDAVLVGGAPRRDIAVLKIDAPADDLVPVRRPDDAYRLRVGQKTVAIGSPFELDHTLTTGVVSALGREVPGFGKVTIPDMIQTDASINPGNSGGPLLDSRGQLIGMNTMIYSQSGGSAGIGFAVPVSIIKRLVPQIIETGSAIEPVIGIRPADDFTAKRLGIEGVIIEWVPEGSAAAQAGFRSASRRANGSLRLDVITAVDGHPVRDFDDLYNALDRFAPGDSVSVTVARDGGTVELDVVLSAR